MPESSTGASRDERRCVRSRAEQARLRRYRRAGDVAAREAFVARHLPLARGLARRYRPGPDELEDLVQVASLALVTAVDRFEPERGVSFASFAAPTIIGELKHHFRDRASSMRIPRGLQELALRVDRVTPALTQELGRSPTVAELARHCGVTVEQVLEALASVTARRPQSLDRPARAGEPDEGPELSGGEDPAYARVDDTLALEGLLAPLSEHERLVLRLRFREDLVQGVIGERLGVSQMQVSRVIRRSIDKLQAANRAPPP